MTQWTPEQRRLLLLFGVIAILSLLSRSLLHSPYGTTSLFYIGVPLLAAVFLIALNRSTRGGWRAKYWNSTRDVFLILMGVSIFLNEGFLCVLMFLPIYLFVMGLVMGVEAIWRYYRKKRRGGLLMHWFPIIAVAAMLEGVHPSLSFERGNHVIAERTVAYSVEELMANLERPMQLQKERDWFLRLFPMPYEIRAQTLDPGDIHEIHFRYHRWFFTNTHEGRMLLEISEVEPGYVRTRFIEDSSYIGNYLGLEGTEVTMQPNEDGTTRITLAVRFQRKLDPAWYFGPLERYGVEKMAEFLIDEVVVRHGESKQSEI